MGSSRAVGESRSNSPKRRVVDKGLAGEAGVYPPRQYGIDLDVVVRPCSCERFGELDHAAFARAIGRCEGRAKMASMDPILMILPPPNRRRCGYALREQRNALVRLVHHESPL